MQQQEQQQQQQNQQQSQETLLQDQNGMDKLLAENTELIEDSLATGSMDEDNDMSESTSAPVNEDVDIEELVQVQKERLERLRRVIVLGEDADIVKQEGEGRTEGEGDYLF
jgi:hypothetical protein